METLSTLLAFSGEIHRSHVDSCQKGQLIKNIDLCSCYEIDFCSSFVIVVLNALPCYSGCIITRIRCTSKPYHRTNAPNRANIYGKPIYALILIFCACQLAFPTCLSKQTLHRIKRPQTWNSFITQQGWCMCREEGMQYLYKQRLCRASDVSTFKPMHCWTMPNKRKSFHKRTL